MNSLKFTQYLILGLPIATILASVPLIMKQVPPNNVYGFRTKHTLSSPGIWYSSNKVCGISLSITSLLALCIMLSLRMRRGDSPSTILWEVFVYSVCLLAGVVITFSIAP